MKPLQKWNNKSELKERCKAKLNHQSSKCKTTNWLPSRALHKGSNKALKVSSTLLWKGQHKLQGNVQSEMRMPSSAQPDPHASRLTDIRTNNINGTIWLNFSSQKELASLHSHILEKKLFSTERDPMRIWPPDLSTERDPMRIWPPWPSCPWRWGHGCGRWPACVLPPQSRGWWGCWPRPPGGCTCTRAAGTSGCSWLEEENTHTHLNVIFSKHLLQQKHNR